jgi:hypothetical protein
VHRISDDCPRFEARLNGELNETLKRMLKSPPKPHSDSQKKSGMDGRQELTKSANRANAKGPKKKDRPRLSGAKFYAGEPS